MTTDLRLATVLAASLILLKPCVAGAQAVSEEELATVADHMHEHLVQISTIKAAIVTGNLQGVRSPAVWLAEHETAAGLSSEFEPLIAQMRGYADQVVEAKDLVAAADSVSKMAKTCGDCHLANDVKLEFGFDKAPREDVEDVVTHMQRHQWAADRLWEGLIGPSDRAWSRGADMLIDVPLDIEDVTTSTDHVTEMREIAMRIHRLASIGSETVARDARADVYGEVLGLCGVCHRLLGRGPAR